MRRFSVSRGVVARALLGALVVGAMLVPAAAGPAGAGPPPPNEAGEYTPITPTRMLDTRGATGGHVGGALDPGETYDVDIADGVAIPEEASVSAVVLNVVAINPTAGGYLTVWPDLITRPTIA